MIKQAHRTGLTNDHHHMKTTKESEQEIQYPTIHDNYMADRGFTVQYSFKEKGVSLNILQIHVERCIGRIKNFKILGRNFPLSMTRIANQFAFG